MIEQTGHVFRAMAVAHTIKTREVRRVLSRCNVVINAHDVLGVRQRNLDNLRSQRLALLDRLAHGAIRLRLDAFDEIFLRHPKPDAFQILAELRGVIRRRFIEAG